jgi:hypothetical protein
MSLFHLSKSTHHYSTGLGLVEAMNGIYPLKISSIPIQIKTKKNVRFADFCKVVLIPMRQEYSAAGIFLWWTKKDFIQFKHGYLIEKQKERERERERERGDDGNEIVIKNSTRGNHFLIISESENVDHLLAQISRSMSIQPTFQICTAVEVESLNREIHYVAVIIDGTNECGCFLNQSCEVHSLNRLNVIQSIRSLSLSDSLTLFVDNSSLSSEKMREMTESGNNATSDLMVITPDSWNDFQLLIERALEKKSEL